MILDQIGAVVRPRVVADRSHSGPGWRVTHDYSCEPLQPRAHQPGELPGNIGHDRQRTIGVVQHLEAGSRPGEALAVCAIHGELPDETLSFSLEGRRGGYDGAVLSALAVTADPASVGLSPLRLVPGEVRQLPEAYTLRLRNTEPHLAGLLERARVTARSRRRGEPLIVENRTAGSVGTSRYPESEYPDRRPPGKIEHSGHRGRILSVR
jgi:hypothetical protein